MGFFVNGQGSRGVMRLLVTQLVWWLGSFSTFALAQFDISEGVTGAVNFPALGITCIANIAVFVTSLIRGRLDKEMGARDVLDILACPKPQIIESIKHGNGLTTCRDKKNDTQTATGGGGHIDTASTEGVLRTAATEEIGLQTVCSGGRGTAATKENVLRTASTEENVLGTGEETSSTEEKVLREGEITSYTKERDIETQTKEDEALSTKGRQLDLQSASLVMLSNGKPNWSMMQFIKSNANIVDSTVLQFFPFTDARVREELTPQVNINGCKCRPCDCIVFWTVEEITSMLVRRMPRSLKLLSDSLYLLPCLICLQNGCHGCNRESMLQEEGQSDEGQTLGSVVSHILKDISAGSISAGEPIGICIPMNDSGRDDWTKLLVKSLKSKDAEGRGTRVMASEALEGYLAGGRGGEEGTVEYHILSFIVPRLTEVLINLGLTFWFRVDGFSSALVARRTVRNYLVDSKSSGFAANTFVTKAVIKSDADNSQVCQVLTFRDHNLPCIITFIAPGCVNLICALGWALLISFEGGADTSQTPTMLIVAVIVAAIGTPWAMGTATFFVVGRNWFRRFRLENINVPRFVASILRFVASIVASILCFVAAILCGLLLMVILPVGLSCGDRDALQRLLGTGVALDAVYIVCGSAMAGTVGIKAFGRWVYGALQILVWVKWAIGTCLLNDENSVEFFGTNPDRWNLVFYSSAFFLNAVLAGVRCKWEAWPWKDNHLFSRNLLTP